MFPRTKWDEKIWLQVLNYSVSRLLCSHWYRGHIEYFVCEDYKYYLLKIILLKLDSSSMNNKILFQSN